jgi:hypothetical protein
VGLKEYYTDLNWITVENPLIPKQRWKSPQTFRASCIHESKRFKEQEQSSADFGKCHVKISTQPYCTMLWN